MRSGDVKQFYVFPTVVISRNRMGKRTFLVWLHWSIEFKRKQK